MNYFDDPENVKQYIRMAQDVDSRALIERLKKYLPEQSSVLEIGMGPGKDLDYLAEHYQVTGSDYSQHFLDRYQEMHPNTPLFQVDAKEFALNLTFDAIYSNKVLHQFNADDINQSLSAQFNHLKPGGLIFHSFWFGTGCECYEGQSCHYYDEKELKRLLALNDRFTLVASEKYDEFDTLDSIWVLARKK